MDQSVAISGGYNSLCWPTNREGKMGSIPRFRRGSLARQPIAGSNGKGKQAEALMDEQEDQQQFFRDLGASAEQTVQEVRGFEENYYSLIQGSMAAYRL